MPRKGENASHAQPVALRCRRDLARALGCDAAAMVAAVDFDDDFRLGSGKRARHDLYAVAGVDTNPQRDPLRQRAQPGSTRARSPYRVGDEQVSAACCCENLRLTYSRNGQADRAKRQLTAGDLEALVGLGVRAEKRRRGHERDQPSPPGSAPAHRGPLSNTESECRQATAAKEPSRHCA